MQIIEFGRKLASPQDDLINKPLGEKPPLAAHLGVNLLTTCLEPADGVTERPLHRAHDLKNHVKMIGHNLAIERPNLWRKLGDAPKVGENGRPKRRALDPRLDLVGFKLQRPRLVNRKPLANPSALSRPTGRSSARSASRGVPRPFFRPQRKPRGSPSVPRPRRKPPGS